MRGPRTIEFTKEESSLILAMTEYGATKRDELTQLLCMRAAPADREEPLSQLALIWQENILPHESVLNLERFLGKYYTEATDRARQRVRLGRDGIGMMEYSAWIELALKADVNSVVKDDAAASERLLQMLGEKMQTSILSRDADRWLQGLIEFLGALPHNPKMGASLRDVILAVQTPGSDEATTANMLTQFDKLCLKTKRLPDVGELSKECGLDKDNALKYRKELGLDGIPRTPRSKKARAY